jgi:hypothetical protein
MDIEKPHQPCSLSSSAFVLFKSKLVCYRMAGKSTNQWCYTLKKVSVFPIPYQTLPGGEELNSFPPDGRAWYVTSRLGTGKSLNFFNSVAADLSLLICWGWSQRDGAWFFVVFEHTVCTVQIGDDDRTKSDLFCLGIMYNVSEMCSRIPTCTWVKSMCVCTLCYVKYEVAIFLTSNCAFPYRPIL